MVLCGKVVRRRAAVADLKQCRITNYTTSSVGKWCASALLQGGREGERDADRDAEERRERARRDKKTLWFS